MIFSCAIVIMFIMNNIAYGFYNNVLREIQSKNSIIEWLQSNINQLNIKAVEIILSTCLMNSDVAAAEILYNYKKIYLNSNLFLWTWHYCVENKLMDSLKFFDEQTANNKEYFFLGPYYVSKNYQNPLNFPIYYDNYWICILEENYDYLIFAEYEINKRSLQSK